MYKTVPVKLAAEVESTSVSLTLNVFNWQSDCNTIWSGSIWYNSTQEHQLIILLKSIKWHNSAEAILLQHGLLSRCGPDIIQREPYSQPPIFLTLSEILFTVIVIVSNWALLQAVEKSKTIESKDLARAFIFLPFIFRENLKSTIKCKVADESSRAVSNKSTWLPFDQFNSAISLISVRSCINVFKSASQV